MANFEKIINFYKYHQSYTFYSDVFVPQFKISFTKTILIFPNKLGAIAEKLLKISKKLEIWLNNDFVDFKGVNSVVNKKMSQFVNCFGTRNARKLPNSSKKLQNIYIKIHNKMLKITILQENEDEFLW